MSRYPTRILPRVHRGPTALLGLSILAVSPLWVGPASAQPVDWVKVKTPAVTMYLPKDWRVFEQKADPKAKWAGAWIFGSPDGRAKLYLRVAKSGQKGDMKQVLEAGLAGLRKQVQELKPLDATSVDQVDRYHFAFATRMLVGKSKLPDPKTQKEGLAETSLARVEQRYWDSKIAITLTYLFGAGRQGELMEFMNTHQAHFRVPMAKEMLRMMRDMAEAQRKAQAAQEEAGKKPAAPPTP